MASELFSKLLAVDHRWDFRQPPPPDLRYTYPMATQAIIKQISKHLATNPAFYKQVVHLMNRMNLPPPFRAPPTVDTACQTDDLKLIRKPDLATDESELDSGEDQDLLDKQRLQPRPVDRRRVRAFIQMEKESRKRKKEDLPEEIPFKRKEIIIKLPEPTIVQDDSGTKAKILISGTERVSISKETALLERIPIEKLKQANPIFQNYSPGTPSNVLYLKNLSKTVSLQDLEQLYAEYTDESSTISIDLKTTGRLRGQAFITFEGEGKQAQRALENTNGCVLKGKPIYVCFSRSKVTEK